MADTSGAGGGFPDLVVALDGVTVLVEVKDGTKPPSRRRRTRAQMEFARGWKGWLEVVKSVPEAHALVDRMRASVRR